MTRVLAPFAGLIFLAACSAPPHEAAIKAPVKTINILQQKVEIAEPLRKMANDYEKEHPGVRMVIETFGGGQDFEAALADRYQAGTLPDVFMSLGSISLDPWVDLAEDLSGQPWVADLAPGTGDQATRGGRLYGNPFAIEGYGFLYNKTLFRKAGIVRPPDTLSSLREACRKLEAAGIVPFANGYAEWWVLGVHNFNRLLGSVSNVELFLKNLGEGGAPGPDAAVVEGWMDLLDLTSRYGSPDALATGSYTASVAAFLAGQAAMIQQGNWIEPDLVKNAPELEVGVLPMPVSDKPDLRLSMGVPNFWVINKNSPVKEEAKQWLEWLHSSPTGRRFLIEELKVIPPYRSMDSLSLGSLSALFAEVWRNGQTLPWAFPAYQDKTKAVAAAMRTYLELRPSHEDFWKLLVRAWGQP